MLLCPEMGVLRPTSPSVGGDDGSRLRRSGLSFTTETLEQLAQESPQTRLFFLIGSDNLPLLPSWHLHHRLLEIATVVTFPRRGYTVRPQDLDGLDLSLAEREALLQGGKHGVLKHNLPNEH